MSVKIKMTLWLLLMLCYSCMLGTNATLTIGPLVPFRDPNLSLEKRIDDLVNRLTDDEIINQVLNAGPGPAAPAIERLGIRPYIWRDECLHGFARGDPATTFPMAINLAAMFNRRAISAVALAVGLEARAIRNKHVAAKNYSEYSGINCYSPVVNIMRHPLWGRNAETYGEDPYLVGQLSRAFVSGLAGVPLDEPIVTEYSVLQQRQTVNLPLPWLPDNLFASLSFNPRRVQLAAATCKHFAVHSGPENWPESRLRFNAKVPQADLWLTHLVAFRACLSAPGAHSVMCAYSSLNGVPDCANPWLLTNLLRKQWGFKGFVVSDEGALQFLVTQHHAFSTNKEAAFAAVRAGVNIEDAAPGAPAVFRSSLHQLVDAGALNREDLLKMVRPLFASRLQQAEFDPPELDVFANLKPDMFVQSNRHQSLAVISTAQSIVLLKRTPNSLFPLVLTKPNHMKQYPLRRLAVLGPFATSVEEIIGDYSPPRMPAFEHPLHIGLKNLALLVDGQDICSHGAACKTLNIDQLTTSLLAEDLTAIVLTLGVGIKQSGESNDRHNIELPGQQNALFNHVLRLNNKRSSGPVPITVIICSMSAVNIKPMVTSNETSLIFWAGLPGTQFGVAMEHLLRGTEPHPTNKHGIQRPFDLLSTNINRDEGRENTGGYWWIPAARLPFTWYASIEHLASITEYRMTNQTYRYLPEECHVSDPYTADNKTLCHLPVAFPFGFGLSYNGDWSQQNQGWQSGFTYSDLEAPKSNWIALGQVFKISVLVTNVGPIAADEVVQAYLQWTIIESAEKDNSTTHVAKRQLIGFDRISLAAGEKTRVYFNIDPDQHLTVFSTAKKGNFENYDNQYLTQNNNNNDFNNDSLVWGRGVVQITLGGQQPEEAITTGSNVLKTKIRIGTLKKC